MSPGIPTRGVPIPASPLPRASEIPTAAAVDSSTRRTALNLVFALLVVALLARTAFLIWEPPFTGTIDYDTIAPLGDTYWAMHLYLGGPAFAATWVLLAVLITFIARGRSAIATFTAAIAIGLGELVFALVTTAEALPFAYAASAFPEPEGRAIFDTLNANLGMLVPPILGSQAVIAAGVLIVLVTGLVTRTMPRWFAIAGLIYLVAFFALPIGEFGRGAVIITDVVQSVLIGGIGWFGQRAGLSRPPRVRPS